MSNFEEVKAALSQHACKVREIDTVVGEIMQGRQDMSVCHGECNKGYELF